jgi:hypothetical protein
MIYEDNYSELNTIDDSGMAKRLYEVYVALSFLQNNTSIVKADDFSVACLLETTPKQVQEKKKLLYMAGYLNYNTDEKIKIIKEYGIIAELTAIEIMKS